MPVKGYRKYPPYLRYAMLFANRYRKLLWALGIEKEDAIQDIAAKLVHCERTNYRADGGAALHTYLYRCAELYIFTVLRRGRMRAEPFMHRHDIDLTSIPDTWDETAERETEDMLQFAFDKIKPRQRRVLLARRRGKTLKQIGEKMRRTRERIRQIEVKGIMYANRAAKKEAVRVGSTFKECWL